jgi:hypothetical protein
LRKRRFFDGRGAPGHAGLRIALKVKKA